VNTYRLEGKSVDALLSLMRLSDVSKEQYLSGVKQFLDEAHISPDELVALARRRPRAFEKQFTEFLVKRGKVTSPATVAGIRNSVMKFLDASKVPRRRDSSRGVDWGFINEHVPERRKFGSDRAPTQEEVRAILNASDQRTRCLYLFLCSSGARIGAVKYLRWRDVREVEHEGVKFAQVTIYAGEREEYQTFITPEAYQHLLEYRRTREGVGEVVTPLSPVFVTAFDVLKPNLKRIHGVGIDALKNDLARVMKRVNLRGVIHEGRNSRRFEFKQAHGARKLFKTRMEMSGVKPIITEMLMGHTLGVAGSYMRPTEREMLQEYAKAIDALTILGTGRSMDKGGVLATIRKEMLSTRYGEEEIREMGDLSKMTTEQFVEALNRKSLGLNGKGSQKVVPAAEVRALVEQGWEYVSQLPDGYTIVRLPRNGLGA